MARACVLFREIGLFKGRDAHLVKESQSEVLGCREITAERGSVGGD
jgi:hypothetical protein